MASITFGKIPTLFRRRSCESLSPSKLNCIPSKPAEANCWMVAGFAKSPFVTAVQCDPEGLRILMHSHINSFLNSVSPPQKQTLYKFIDAKSSMKCNTSPSLSSFEITSFSPLLLKQCRHLRLQLFVMSKAT